MKSKNQESYSSRAAKALLCESPGISIAFSCISFGLDSSGKIVAESYLGTDMDIYAMNSQLLWKAHRQ